MTLRYNIEDRDTIIKLIAATSAIVTLALSIRSSIQSGVGSPCIEFLQIGLVNYRIRIISTMFYVWEIVSVKPTF